jgi:hypothetical protein
MTKNFFFSPFYSNVMAISVSHSSVSDWHISFFFCPTPLIAIANANATLSPSRSCPLE